MYREILYDVQNPVAVITMNRPEALNALTGRMMAEMRHALAAAEADPAVVGIVLTGAGRGFCAGADMAGLNATASGEDGAREDMSDLKANPGNPDMGPNFEVTYSYLLSISKPLIAAVNGPCAGLGFVYASLADMRFVERQAKLTTAFSQRGLIAEHGSSWILPRVLGPGRALDLLWSARKFLGEEAMEIGWADRLVDEGEALQAATNYIKLLAETASPISLKVIKAQVYRHLNMELGDAMRETNEWMAESLVRDDFKEGVRSFMEKRPPEFKRVGSE
ncbi:MAG: enoyl-CoA hydratase-related protein [Pseudomonadales bacterium]|jgi:enoyl-CoA hydratase/carnithine racemase|nr:enoyl-CoA hydratase [Acidiferrobacteraceae bacterium]MDP6375457.1 enoyl-CoA hydratase-related protein [Pseudomonadales bacterium]MDP6470638.1 enoyl-CoA hydratase-related protein [Pseudomonadales bacterium]MDP6828506.1 enoyl-CoA hydratase-related protein [Pseudomonadales bacterium]MDP6970509.1 enoyl-CoA hydratase-related protein [Pseudomonadales bacterium]|tara:strand:+ start:267 stop:1100 length:834 start_codon:yes stop_codon:yes gene_type:complete